MLDFTFFEASCTEATSVGEEPMSVSFFPAGREVIGKLGFLRMPSFGARSFW